MSDLLAEARLAPLRLAEKEGMALVNGTQATTGLGVLAVRRLVRALETAEVVGSASLEGVARHSRARSGRRSTNSVLIRGRPRVPGACGRSPKVPGSGNPTAKTTRGFKTHTLCAACPRSTALPAMPWTMSPRCSQPNATQPPTTRSCCPNSAPS